MTFKEFWKNNRNRYKDLSGTSVMLAINTAAEESWELSQKQTIEYTQRFTKHRNQEDRK